MAVDRLLSEQQSVLLYSGGLASLIHYLMLGRPTAVYVHAGSRVERAERNAIDAQVRNIDGMKVHNVEAVPFGRSSDSLRGAVFPLVMSAMVGAPEASVVYTGHTNGYTTRQELKRVGRQISEIYERRIEVLAPFLDYSLYQLVEEFKGAYPERWREYISLTRSCDNQTVNPLVRCGECLGCVRRWAALAQNGLFEFYPNAHPSDHSNVVVESMVNAFFSGEFRRTPDLAVEWFNTWTTALSLGATEPNANEMFKVLEGERVLYEIGKNENPRSSAG